MRSPLLGLTVSSFHLPGLNINTCRVCLSLTLTIDLFGHSKLEQKAEGERSDLIKPHLLGSQPPVSIVLIQNLTFSNSLFYFHSRLKFCLYVAVLGACMRTTCVQGPAEVRRGNQVLRKL